MSKIVVRKQIHLRKLYRGKYTTSHGTVIVSTIFKYKTQKMKNKHNRSHTQTYTLEIGHFKVSNKRVNENSKRTNKIPCNK